MNPAAKWGIILGAGIPGVLVVIGLIGLSVKFFMKRCRSKAWEEINTLPKHLDSSETAADRRPPKHLASEREPLCSSATLDIVAESDGHIKIPIHHTTFEHDQPNNSMTNDHTLAQIQRDRLNHLKEEENRSRPMKCLSKGENDMQHAIEQALKEFDESTANSAAQMKSHQTTMTQ